MDDDGKIFIIGHARSGTTLLCDFLNTAKDTFILKEAELYWRSELPAFPEFFNRRSTQLRLAWLKGNYLPPCLPSDLRGDQVLARLAEFYPRVGDKIALGPGRPEQLKIWEYYATHYFRSTYIFSFRQPVAALRSMRRLLPNDGYGALLGAWLQALDLMIRFLSFLPRVYVIPVERMSDGVLGNLNARLGIEAIVAGASIRPPQALDPAEALPGVGTAELAQLDRCRNIYDDLYHSWNDEFLGFSYRQNAYEYWRHYSQEIASIAEALNTIIAEPYGEPVTAVTDPRRGVLNAYGETGYLNEEWVRIAQSYLQDFADDGYGHYTMALMLSARHEHQPALQHFEEALRYGHDPFWVRFNRAELRRRMGDYRAALEDIEAAVGLNSGHARAQQLLSEIRHAKPA